MEVEELTEITFSTPIHTQIKPPIIKLPFLIIDDKYSLVAICHKLIDNFDDFLREKEKIIVESEVENKEKTRIDSEKLFSEWAFKLVNENGM